MTMNALDKIARKREVHVLFWGMLLAVISLTLLFAGVSGTDYYVATGGNNGNGGAPISVTGTMESTDFNAGEDTMMHAIPLPKNPKI